jgi:hypothetical protein
MEKVEAIGNVRNQRAHRLVYSQSDDTLASQTIHHNIGALVEARHHPLVRRSAYEHYRRAGSTKNGCKPLEARIKTPRKSICGAGGIVDVVQRP